MSEIFSNPRRTMMLAIGWSVFDIVLHIVVDSLEWQRISGNVAVIAAGAACQVIASGRTNTQLVVAAAVATIVLNAIWMVAEAAAPPIAVILIAGALACLFIAGRKFWAEAEADSTSVIGDRFAS